MIVDLLPSEQQQLIEDSIRGVLAARLPVSRLREAASHGAAAERAAWDSLAELGLFGLGVAEARGGLGLGAAEEALAARALGRHLVSPAVLAQMLAPHVADDDGLRDALIAGDVRAAFCNAEGAILQLIDSEEARYGLLLGDGIGLIDLPTITSQIACLDETIAMGRGAGALLGTPRSIEADRASLLFAAYLVGIAQAALDMAVDYASTREQFGQPIGAFQAIKHICADMAVRAAAAESQVFHAAITFAAGVDDRAEVAAARLLAGDAALANAKANLQIHGGMGFTAECDAHLYLKRAHVVSVLGSSRRAEQGRLLAGAIL